MNISGHPLGNRAFQGFQAPKTPFCCQIRVKGNGPAGLAIKGKQVIICEDLLSNPSAALFRDKMIERNYRSCCIIPFDIKEFEIEGALCIYSDLVGSINTYEVNLLKDMVSSMTFGIKSHLNNSVRNRLNEALQRNLLDKHNLFLQTISAIASIQEVRDPYTGGHQKNVTKLTVAIANELGLDNHTLEAAFVAAAIHDIGKISVPSEILSKPGRLTPMEFGIVKEHCEIGYNLLREIQFPWPIARIVYEHHERIDGSGYPKGLKSDEIHIIARIIAVADTVDAMASHRPYRASLGIEKALEEISQMKGIKYDPKVVDTCLYLFKDKGYRLTDFKD